MTGIVECVPNFSEGRHRRVLNGLAEALRGVPGAHLLDQQADAFHNRSVFTLAGDPEAMLEAAFRGVVVALEEIDLNQHRGQHPRMGAADVVPFVPLDGTTMDDCIDLARALGARIGEELAIPVFLYGKAATRPERENLAHVRLGQFEGLAASLGRSPERMPDFGPPRIHPTAGATAVGARGLLVAYNVYLDTDDLQPARAIARAIRTSGGGLPGVKALAFEVDGRAQVSTNLVDLAATTPIQAFRAIATRAGSLGVAILKSEIVGLCPEGVLSGADASEMRLQDSREAHLLEPKVRAALG